MASYALAFLVILALFSNGNSLTEITLPEETRNWVSNDLIGLSIGIPKWWFDTLESCHIVFPSGITYEAYPNDNIPNDNISFLSAVQPFTACSVGFKSVGPEFSGTYQLLSVVRHGADDSLSLTRQSYHINIILSES